MNSQVAPNHSFPISLLLLSSTSQNSQNKNVIVPLVPGSWTYSTCSITQKKLHKPSSLISALAQFHQSFIQAIVGQPNDASSVNKYTGLPHVFVYHIVPVEEVHSLQQTQSKVPEHIHLHVYSVIQIEAR